MGLEVSALEAPRKKHTKDKPDRMPGHRIVIETDRQGQPVRVIRRHSTSHGGHHHHHHWDEERADITNGELASMRERERLLMEANDAFARENHTLKVNLEQAERTNRYHVRVEAQLRTNIQSLAVENGDLRRSLEAHRNLEGRHQTTKTELRHEITRLKNENDGLRIRIRQLTKDLREAVDDKVRELTDKVSTWMRRYEDLDRRSSRLSDNLNAYIKERDDLKDENTLLARQNANYRSILRRNRLI